MHRLICAFVVNIWQKQIFSWHGSFYDSTDFIWAGAWQTQQKDLCTQQRLWSAWASTQSDQFSLYAQWTAKDRRFLHVDSEDWWDRVDAQADQSSLGAQVILMVLSCCSSFSVPGGSMTHSLLCEPVHDKTSKMTVRPAKTQISLGIRPVWSESSLCTLWVAKDPSFLHADSEDSDQTGRIPRLIYLRWAHMPFCWFCYEVALNLSADFKSSNAVVDTMMCCFLVPRQVNVHTDPQSSFIGESAAGISREDFIDKIASDVLGKIPQEFELDKIRKKYGLDISPTTIVLLQELERWNALVNRMRKSLVTLKRVGLFLKRLILCLKEMILCPKEADPFTDISLLIVLPVFAGLNIGQVHSIFPFVCWSVYSSTLVSI